MKYCNKCSTPLTLKENWTEARKKHHMNICNSCSHLKSKTWKQNNKEKAKLSSQKSKLKANYNLSIEEYNSKFKDQNGCCAICGKHQSSFKLSLDVDHNHITGVNRGLLCNNCNTALGKFKESIMNLEMAIEYLRKYNYED